MNDIDEELFEIIKNNDIAMAEVLIKNGADTNAIDEDERTPLHYAAMEGYTQMADLLITNNAIIDALDYWNNTPLDLAVCNGWSETAKFLKSIEEKNKIVNVGHHLSKKKPHSSDRQHE